MKLEFSIAFTTLSVFWLIDKGALCSLSCVRTFLLEKRVKNLALVDQKSDLPLAAFYDTAEWTIITSTDENLALDTTNTIASDVVITTSAAYIRDSSIGLTKGHVCVVLNDEHPSIHAIWSVFSKFKASIRNDVVIIATMGKNLWRFYRFVKSDCSENGRGSVEVVADCDENERNGMMLHFENNTKLDGKKCPLVVAATNFEPYTYYNQSRGFYKGIDYFLIENIAKQLQIGVTFIRTDADSTKCVSRELN